MIHANLRKWLVLISLCLVAAACTVPDRTTSSPAQPASETSQDADATIPPPSPSSTAPPTATARAIPTPRPYRLKPGELVLAADKDDIPAIFADDTLFVDAEAGSDEWDDREPVIGLVVDDDARAYPVRLLSLHEIVNDVVGGRPVAVTWCPLCYSAMVFDRVVDGRELTFGVSGYLLHNNLVMYDHQTNTLWSQLLGEGVRGAHWRERLDILPSTLTTWGAWQEEHPETLIISAEQLGRRADEIVDPYASYYSSGVSGLSGSGNTDERLSGKTLVVGLAVGDQARAYPVQTVKRAGVVNDQLGPRPVLLVYDKGLETVVVYQRRVDDRDLTFASTSEAGLVRDTPTGSLWDVRTGRAVKGPLSGVELSRLNGPLVFWFAWSAHHPDTQVYAAP